MKPVLFCVAWVLFGVLSGSCDAKSSGTVWPQNVEVDYQVFIASLKVGRNNLPVGKARYWWHHDSDRYQMRLTLDVVGELALLYKLGYEQRSQGTIDEHGLRPLRFDVTQQGKTPEVAVFDWESDSGARVSLRRGGQERRSIGLVPGDQDMLSVWQQAGYLSHLPESLLVVGNKNARRVQIAGLEDASLQVPAGRFMTRRFSAQSEDGEFRIELWLARDQHMIPVRAVLTGPRSETFILEAVALRVPRK